MKNEPKAKKLHPLQHFPRCEAEVGFEALKWRRRVDINRKGPFSLQCRNFSKYEINGKTLCGKHAGIYALNILLGEEE